MKYDIKLKNISGIYAIVCIPTNKRYVGKSINLYNRLKSHTTGLNCKLPKHENPYLINAWHKYGECNFRYDILEFCSSDDLSKRELFWMKKYNVFNPEFGYNLRKDTESGMVPSESTKRKMSISHKKRYKNMSNKEREIMKENGRLIWKNHSKQKIEEIKDNLSKSRTKYKWFQYDKDMNLVNQWLSVRDILKNNPNYKRHNIYACASGEKPSMYNFIWKKVMI
jgi:group I intron endonuclease